MASCNDAVDLRSIRQRCHSLPSTIRSGPSLRASFTTATRRRSGRTIRRTGAVAHLRRPTRVNHHARTKDRTAAVDNRTWPNIESQAQVKWGRPGDPEPSGKIRRTRPHFRSYERAGPRSKPALSTQTQAVSATELAAAAHGAKATSVMLVVVRCTYAPPPLQSPARTQTGDHFLLEGDVLAFVASRINDIISVRVSRENPTGDGAPQRSHGLVPAQRTARRPPPEDLHDRRPHPQRLGRTGTVSAIDWRGYHSGSSAPSVRLSP